MIRELAQGVEGVVSLAVHAPGQAWRTWKMLPPDDRAAVLRRVGLGDDMHDNYYFGNPQLFKMPRQFREPGPSLTPTPGLGYTDSTFDKALPYLAGGIALVVVYNLFFRKKGR